MTSASSESMLPKNGGHRKGPSSKRETPGSERRCVVTGAVLPKDALLRFVIAPDGVVVPDLEGTLPGRGIWLSARRDVVETATRKKAFSRAARRQTDIPADLAERVEGMLRRRCLDLLGFARRSGVVTAGFDQVKAAAKAGGVILLFEASDGAADGRRKIVALIPGVAVYDGFSGAELASALGRDHVVHVAVSQGNQGQRLLVARLKKELERLDRYRGHACSSSPETAEAIEPPASEVGADTSMDTKDEPGR